MQLDASGRQDATCACGATFCSLCGLEAHDPAPCWAYRGWKVLANENLDTASVDYMNSTFRRCPNCGVSISKDGGCKHMTCSNCNHEYCHLCGKEWQSVGGYSHVCAGGIWSSSVFGVWLWNTFIVNAAAGGEGEVPGQSDATAPPAAGLLSLEHAMRKVGAMDMAQETVRGRVRYMCERVEMVQQIVHPLPLPLPCPRPKFECTTTNCHTMVEEHLTEEGDTAPSPVSPAPLLRAGDTDTDTDTDRSSSPNIVRSLSELSDLSSEGGGSSVMLEPRDPRALWRNVLETDEPAPGHMHPWESPALGPYETAPVQLPYTASSHLGSVSPRSLISGEASPLDSAPVALADGPTATVVGGAAAAAQPEMVSTRVLQLTPPDGAAPLDGTATPPIPPLLTLAAPESSADTPAPEDDGTLSPLSTDSGGAFLAGLVPAAADAAADWPPRQGGRRRRRRRRRRVEQVRIRCKWESVFRLSDKAVAQYLSALATMHVEFTPLHQPVDLLRSAAAGAPLHSWRAKRRVLLAALRVLFWGLNFMKHTFVCLFFLSAGDAINARGRGDADKDAQALVRRLAGSLSSRDMLAHQAPLLSSMLERLLGATDVAAVSLDSMNLAAVAGLSLAVEGCIAAMCEDVVWRQAWNPPGFVANRKSPGCMG